MTYNPLIKKVETLIEKINTYCTIMFYRFQWLRLHWKLATTADLKNMENRIMSKISDFAATMTAFSDQIDTAIGNLQGDVQNLADQIAALQASQGQITPEDQALLDGIQARAASIAANLAALDGLTPPVVVPPPAE
jgi:conjugal transfer/entry exclusion protein